MTTQAVRVLLFSRTAGYRHASIPAGIDAIGAELAGQAEVDATEDAAAFTRANLARYRAVVFLNTSGPVLDAGQKAAFEAYIRAGGGFAGVHCAAATEDGWPFYRDLVGAQFQAHPPVQPATVRVEDPDHPATVGLPRVWPRIDEWYDFRTNPRGAVRVLLTVDESSYDGGATGADHPLAWCRARSFYTALGHTVESYAEPELRAHLAGGIRYAAGLA
jgi:type 1 glutamine amidotransferase